MKRSNTPSKLSPQRGARIALLLSGCCAVCTLTVTGLLPRPLFDALFLCGLLALSARCIRVVLPRMTPRQREWLYVWVYVPLFCFFLPGSARWRDTEAGLGERIRTPAYVAVAFLFIAAHIFYFLYKNKPKMRKKIVAGNWKMNTLPAEGAELAKGIVAQRATAPAEVNFIVCPPFTHLSQVAEALKGSNIALGAQNCAAEEKGAYTGEVSAAMIAALGCRYVILGHSERRQYYGETSETLNLKMARAYAHGLTPVYCVGENLEEREAGKHFDVVKAQIEEVVCNLTPEQFAGLVIAYEPVWAIGTGKTATADQAQEIHAFIRKVLADKFGAAAAETPILYGGSCKPSNAAELFAKEDVDGGLIGGAALKAEDFLGIGQGFAK